MEHIHSSHCHHDRDDDDANQPIDPAMQSLADALKVSFRVLSIGMLLFVLLFLATGIGSVEPQEQGIVKVFGKVTRTVPKGLVYNWPFPIGEIQKVSTMEKKLEIDSFWMFETPQDKLKPLSARSRNNQGLRPGYDGYLITGDRNIIHIKFACIYKVADPLTYVSVLADPEQALREVLCDAAVEAAATRTADSIQYNHELFLNQVQELAQKKIDAVMGFDSKGGGHGIVINNILLPQPDAKTWPLGAFDAYEKAQRAKSEKQTAINKAVATAKETLINSVGSINYIELVGEPWEDVQKCSEQPAYNLIALYGQIDNAADNAAVVCAEKPTAANKAALEKIRTDRRRIWDTINVILTRATIGGEASKIIAQAESEKTAIIENAQRRAKRFDELHVQYEKAPQLFLNKMWANVYDELMSSPTVEKWYLSPGKMGSILKINSDPAVKQAIRDYKLKQEKERKTREQQ
ncbi:MAG TPA: SPFH domain-containing protein [Phycisphaerae bacterium]|nr:SPFH domain-containing protein [Phycisphaerae bacterium]HPS52606.1 SPFH domain-containing protein [Phycisphaerae bacterium]